jgi:hypothetical protein
MSVAHGNGGQGQGERHYRYLDVVTGLFVAVLIISNVASTKQLLLGTFALDGGTIIFPLAYIFGDILTEVYGYSRSRRVIWIGFVCVALATLVFGLVGALPPADYWPYQDAYNAILGQTPRLVIASLLAYFVGEFANSLVLAKLKVRTEGRYLWLRTIGSTLVGQTLDTLVFVVVAFAGLMPESDLLNLVVANVIFKIGVEVVFTPITYRVVGVLKRVEREDYYDRDTNFNPFVLPTLERN